MLNPLVGKNKEEDDCPCCRTLSFKERIYAFLICCIVGNGTLTQDTRLRY